MIGKSILELVIGNLDEKREYRRIMKRVNALPADYRYVYKKLMNYSYNFDFGNSLQRTLLELFEESAADGRLLRDVVGKDAAAFCDGLMRVNEVQQASLKKQMNREIAEHFHRNGDK